MTNGYLSPALFALFFTLVLSGCNTKKDSPQAQEIKQAMVVPKSAFSEKIEPQLFELTSGALSVWRTFKAAKPTLLLFASHPLLNPIPENLLPEVKRVIESGHDTELLRRGSASAADVLFASPQTVSAALEGGLLAEVIVVIPTKEKKDAISLEKFTQRAQEAGFLTQEEATKLTLQDGIISGTVRNIPLRVIHPEALPPITTPLLLHIDLGYFKENYVNDIKTPIYDLIYEFTAAIRAAGYKPTAVTLSFSNQEVGYALTSRFVIKDLASLFRYPNFLDGKTPTSWSLRSAALYASLMFNEERARTLTEQAAKETPDDAAALFDLSILRFQQGQADEGFSLLDQAVALDRGYALAYLELADQGQSMGQWSKSFELLQKATKAFPDNAEIRMRLAGDLIQRGRAVEARPLLDALEKLSWSGVYHADVPEILSRMQTAAKIENDVALPDAAAPQIVPQRKQQGMPPSHMGFPPQQ